MKRIRRRGIDESGASRKRPVTSTVAVDDRSSLSWKDVDSDDDEEDLQQHTHNLNAFCVNVVSFLDEFQGAVMAMISASKIDPAFVNTGLKALELKITAVLCGLSQSHIYETVSYEDNGMSSLLDAREAEADALYERVVKEFGQQYLTRDSGLDIALTSPEVDPSVQQPRESILDNSLHLSPARDEICLMTDGNDSGRGEQSDGNLPAFLVGLKPRYDDTGTREWCRGCGAIKSLVPAHWSNSLHLTLHRLRVAIPPPGTFVSNDERVTMRRTVRAVGKRPRANVFYYRVFRIHPNWCNDIFVRSIQEYVDAELGVSETGIKRCDRVAYVSVALRHRDGPATAVIGYLESEPLTTADAHHVYALNTDGHLMHLHRDVHVKYGVSRLWVAVGYRRQGVGTNMLDVFRDDHSLCGRDITFAAHEIQFGHTFIRNYITAAATRNGDDDITVLIYTNSPSWYK